MHKLKNKFKRLIMSAATIGTACLLAGCGAGAGIAWLNGGRFEDIANTHVNSLAIIYGTICDGSKASD